MLILSIFFVIVLALLVYAMFPSLFLFVENEVLTLKPSFFANAYRSEKS